MNNIKTMEREKIQAMDEYERKLFYYEAIQ